MQPARQAGRQQPARQRAREKERAWAERAERVRGLNPPRPISCNFHPTPPIIHRLPRGFRPRPSGAQTVNSPHLNITPKLKPLFTPLTSSPLHNHPAHYWFHSQIVEKQFRNKQGCASRMKTQKRVPVPIHHEGVWWSGERVPPVLSLSPK